jgi:hypothetical protein
MYLFKKTSPLTLTALVAAAIVAAVILYANNSTSAAHTSPWIGLVFGGPTTLLGGLLFFISRNQVKQSGKTNRQPEVSQPWTKAPEATRAGIVTVSNIGASLNSPEVFLDFVETLVTPGRRVLIVDCEAGGALTESVGLTGKNGFSDFLAEDPDLRYFTMPVWNSTREGIFIMPAGTEPGRIAALLSKPSAADALKLLREEFDQAVINAPAILTAGAMRDLTPLSNGIVLITPAERSLTLASEAMRQVEEYGGHVLALVDERAPQFEAV